MSVENTPITPLKSTQYSLEPCAGCQGTGVRCQACEGQGVILVAMPVTKCSHCHGNGMERNRPASASPVCISCDGTGWENVVRVMR